MLLFKIKMFFNSAIYRKCILWEIKNFFIYCIKFPCAIARDIYDTLKLYKEYPNEWERYTKIKKMKKKDLKESRKKEALEAYSSFENAIFCLNLGWISYCSFTRRKDITQEDYQKLFDEFEKSKKNFFTYVSKLEWRGVAIPKELVTMVEETEIDRFSSMEEYEKFAEKLETLIDSINLLDKKDLR